MQGLDYQNWTMRFVAGLNQKSDARSLEPPELAICRDVSFDSVGGLQTRYPFVAFGSNSIFGGGTMSDCRRLVEHGDELLCFTKDALYSWNAQLSKWVLKGTHLAVKLTEKNAFVTNAEQEQCDRAELNNTVMYSWAEKAGTTYRGYVAAMDKTTGNILMVPTVLPGAAYRLRLVALTTKILLTFYDGVAGLYAYALDPASPATALAGASTTLTNTNFGEYYDITKVIGADQAVFACCRNPTVAYLVGTVTSALVVATSVKARICDGPIAVSSAPNGTHVQIARCDVTASAIKGDYIAIAGLVDVYTAQAIGVATSIPVEITCAHRSVADSGQYRCYVFWTDSRSTDGVADWSSRSNWVDTGNSLGTDATFLRRVDIGSRAFDHEGRVYLWMVWGTAAGTYGSGGELQNASFLYRDDAFLVAKAAWNRGAGFLLVGHLPGVASIGTGMYAYCGTERTVFGELGSSTFTGKRPREAVVTFDSNEARRTAAIGRTLYITGGEILQYDGQRLTELGFHVWPWYMELSSAVGGALETGTYAYKVSYRSDNARAERDRSAAIRIDTFAVAAGPKRIRVASIIPLYITHKPTLAGEVWRTLKNPIEDAPYYLASTSDPSRLTNPNRYLPNDTTAANLPTMNDDRSDADHSTYGENPQDVQLPNLAPPAASIIFATETRLFLAGVAGEPNSVWYSKQRSEGDVVAFNGGLVASVPIGGGEITALEMINDTLVVFRETAIYALPGDGNDNTGGGVNYGPAREIPGAIGAVNQESVVSTDQGLVFKSSKGWYLLSTSFALEYIGAGIKDYDDEVPLAAQLIESQHEIRLLTSSRMLVLDTLVKQWGEWTIADGVHACMWGGQHTYLTSTGPKQQATTYAAGVDYGMDVETGWIKLADLQGFGRVRELQALGEFRSAHHLRVRVARDYMTTVDGTPDYFDDEPWTPSPFVVGPLQVSHGPSEQQVEAIKVRLTATAIDDTTAPTGEALKLTGLSMRLGFKPGLFKRLPRAQQQ